MGEKSAPLSLRDSTESVSSAGVELAEPKASKPKSLAGKLDLALLAVLGLALLVRLYAWWQAPRAGFVIDEAEYYQIASILADGRGWAFYEAATWVRPPLYVLLLGGVFRAFGPNLIIVRLIQTVLSVGSVYLLYRLGYRAYGRRTGLIAGFLAAIAWPFAVLSYLLLSETLFIFLFLVAINLLGEYQKLRNQKLEIRDQKLEIRNQEAGQRGQELEHRGQKPAPTTYPSSLIPHPSSFIPHPSVLLALAGLFLGLSALTRGQVLSFVPFIGLWLWVSLGWRQWRKAFLAFAIVVVAFGLTISPWAVRNYSTYGRPFIDTTGGYNFYLGVLHGRNGAQVSQTLEAVKNQATRENLGYSKGLELIAKDPLDYIKKGFKESLDFWNINFGADERLEKAYTTGIIPPSWLLPDQLLGDTLYILLGVLALIGLVTATSATSGLRSFVAIWTVYNMALAFAFFAVSRFRLPVYYFLLLFAAYVLANPRQVWGWFIQPLKIANRSLQGGRWLIGLAAPLLFLIIVIPTYSPDQTIVGVNEWAKQQNALRGDALRKEGRYDEALAAYAQATQRIPATQIGIGLTEALQGRYDDAIGRIGRTTQDIAQSHLALGWIYLRQGNEVYARSEFRSRQISLDSTADRWAWDNLTARPLPDNLLRMGEFDWGYLDGFHIYEKEDNNPNTPFFRWTADRGESGQERARLRFPLAPGSRPKEVALRLNGFRPDSLTPPQVEVFANGRSLGKIQTSRTWQTYMLSLPADLPASSELILELAPSSTFVPGADSRRELGVMVQWAKLNG